jgi:hypothetical protein
MAAHSINNLERFSFSIKGVLPEESINMFTDATMREVIKLVQKGIMSKDDVVKQYQFMIIKFSFTEYLEILDDCLEEAYSQCYAFLTNPETSIDKFKKKPMGIKTTILEPIGFFDSSNSLKNELETLYKMRNAILHREGLTHESIDLSIKASRPAGITTDPDGSVWQKWGQSEKRVISFKSGDIVCITLEDVCDIVSEGIGKITDILMRGYFLFAFNSLGGKSGKIVHASELPLYRGIDCKDSFTSFSNDVVIQEGNIAFRNGKLFPQWD